MKILSAAQTAKAYGGKVIAQVKYAAKKGAFHSKDEVVPGYLVDGYVLAQNPETEHCQTPSTVYSPTFSGDNIKTPLKILNEGKIKKFTEQVKQITFSGKYAAKHLKDVMYVTERAVFILSKEGLTLAEIAPALTWKRIS